MRLPVVCCLLLLGLGTTRAATDRFGVTQLHSTVANGREWFAAWDNARVVKPYCLDPADRLMRNEEGELTISGGVARTPAGMTRLVVLTPTNAAGPTAPLWRNVEMTIYARRGAAAKRLDYQAFYLSARSGERHNDSVPCEGTSYHGTLRFDGQAGFKKELWHPGGYTQLRPSPTPRPWTTVPESRWIGLKLVVRNCNGDRQVRLEMHLDAEGNNQWKSVSEFTDAGGWKGEKPGCDRAPDAIITEGRPAVYFRTDQVATELKFFSVREIAPLP